MNPRKAFNGKEMKLKFSFLGLEEREK